MPELKNTFTGGKMDKDQDERILGSGLYREALNIEVATSEDSDVGAAQNILGNVKITEAIAGPRQDYSSCSLTIWNESNPARYYGTNQHIAHVVDPQADKLYRFINTEPTSSKPHGVWMDRIVEYDTNSNVQDYWLAKEKAVMVDIYKVETTVHSIDAEPPPPPPPPPPGECEGIQIGAAAPTVFEAFTDVAYVASTHDIQQPPLMWYATNLGPIQWNSVRGYRIYHQLESYQNLFYPQWMIDNFAAFHAIHGNWGVPGQWGYPMGPSRTTWADIIADVNFVLDDGLGTYVLNPDTVNSADIITLISSLNIPWVDSSNGNTGFLSNIISYQMEQCEDLTVIPT